MEQQPQPALILFARAPVPGATKTRLVPALGREGAAGLYRCFLLDMLSHAAATGVPVFVAAAEPDDVPVLQELLGAACPQAAIFAQLGNDLGERMLNAFRHGFAFGYRQVVLLGSDVPSVPWNYVTQALASAQDLVVGPCLDGGYYLIGAHRVYPELFLNMRWSAPAVCADTLTRARGQDLTVQLLNPWYDVDLPEDLAVLSRHLTALSLANVDLPCPNTYRYLLEIQKAGWRV